ncbi:hypothetical protein AnigIFM63309_010628 [Aspergillus niger]|nr:hypothetical protein AnigIFM63309_010628 [Aspergillus niger]
MVDVVTGGSSDNALATNGASRVYILGHRKESFDDTANIRPGIIFPIVADVGSKNSLAAAAAAADQIESETGYINPLVANAEKVFSDTPRRARQRRGQVPTKEECNPK